MLDEARSRVVFPKWSWGQRLIMPMAIASSLQSSVLRVAFCEVGAREEILCCSRVKQVKYKLHPLNL